MKKNLYFYNGLTLVELLVGIVVGLVVLSAAGGAMMSYIKSYSDSQKILNLNQNMRAAMDIMAREIRRAGYVSSDVSDIDKFKDNPFFKGDYDLTTYNNGQCIVFSYEKDKISGVSLGDKAGFKLGADKNVQMRKIKYENVNSACDWSGFDELEGITDDDIIVDKLIFKIEDSQGNTPPRGIDVNNPGQECDPNSADSAKKDCLYVRSVRIELSAHVEKDPEIKQTLVQTVKIRNDKFTPKTSP